MQVKCSFRIIGLSKVALKKMIKDHLQGLCYYTGSYYKDKSQKVLRLPIDEDFDIKVIKELLIDVPKELYCDFFISVSSEQQTALVEIPTFILDFHSIIGGKICFSYTCITLAI